MKTYINNKALFLVITAVLFFCLGSLAQALSIPPEGQAVVTDDDAGTNELGAVFIVNLITGQRTLVSDFGDPAQGPLGFAPVGIALEDINTVLVADEDVGFNGYGALFRVNLRTGNRTLISDFENPAQGPEGRCPIGVVLDGPQHALVIDDDAGTNGDGALFRVRLSTGNRTIISDFGDPAQGPIGEDPQGVALDGNGNALVADHGPGLGTLFLVDLSTGQRTIISDFNDPSQGVTGGAPFNVILDPTGNALVIDEDGGPDNGALILVDLTPGPNLGDRTLISDFQNPAQGPTSNEPQGLALESPGQVLVVDGTSGPILPGLLFRVDRATGDRTVISDFDDPAQGPIGARPRGVAFRSAEIVRQIPTLSEWGLIATAGILGLAGLYAMRRRRVSA